MAASPPAIGQGGTSDADAEVGGAGTVIGESAFSWENPNANLFATGLDQRSAGLILNHFFPRLPTEYVESSAFAMRPSWPATRAAWRNGSISCLCVTILRAVRYSDGTRRSRLSHRAR